MKSSYWPTVLTSLWIKIMVWGLWFLLSYSSLMCVSLHSSDQIFEISRKHHLRIFQRDRPFRKASVAHQSTPIVWLGLLGDSTPVGFPNGSDGKNLPAMRETGVQFQGGEDLREKGMATHSSILAWRTPRTEEPGGRQSMRLQRVGRDWDFSFTSLCI